jgi:superfamily II DNA or RNA helicase
VKQRPYQLEQLACTKKDADAGIRQLLIAAATGTGKCLAKGTPVLIFDGTVKNVEDVVVGDLLMGPDSTPRTVLSLARGREEMFTVTPVKGDPYTVNRSHILSLYLTPTRAGRVPEYVNISVDEYLGKHDYFKHRAKGYRVGVEFAESEVTVDPYFLGLWLGDGDSDSKDIHCPDVEVISYLEDYARQRGFTTSTTIYGEGGCPVTRIVTGKRGPGKKCPILEGLRRLNVIQNKHIPHVYKANSREIRLQLLAGLVDTDGSLSCGGFEITSKFEVLANDILFLARSLGFAANKSSEIKSCQTGASDVYHRVFISGDLSEVPVKVIRKVAPKRQQKKNHLVTGIQLNSVGEGDYYGFEIDGDKLFLLGDFTVTHNTEYMAALPKFLGLGGQSLILVHRDELAGQAAKKIKLRNPDLKVSIEMGDRWADLDSDVIVASVQTLGTATGMKRLARWNKDNVKLVLTDEAHHSTATSYVNIYQYFDMLANRPDKLNVGVTATPGRADGVALAKVYKKITHSYPIKQAIEDGYLCDVRAIRLKTGTDISFVKSTAGDFQQGQLSEAVNNPKRNQLVVKAWLDNAKGKVTIAFCVDIQHSKDLAAMFVRHGVRAAAVWGNDPERAWKLARHQGPAAIEEYCVNNGLPVPSPEAMQELSLDVLCNCDVLTEGYDDWRVACIIMARPTKSQVAFVQRVGRGLRLQFGVDNLKVALAEHWALEKIDCLIIDVVDSTTKNSLVTLPSIFGMSGDLDLQGKSATKAYKAIEKAQQEHPNVDFSELENIDQIQATVEAADIWEVKFPEEIESNSQLAWHRTFDGAYVINIPNKDVKAKDQIQIRQNTLGQWEITAVIQYQKYRGQRETLEKALQAADELLMSKAGDSIIVLKREAEWHDDDMTDGQERMLKRLLKGRPIPAGLKKGQASKLISQIVAGKVQGKQVVG